MIRFPSRSSMYNILISISHLFSLNRVTDTLRRGMTFPDA
jgi:hypothetical protein